MLADKTIDLALHRPTRVLRAALLLCLLIIGGVAAPFVAPEVPLPKLTIDTDPENMLAENHPARIMNRGRVPGAVVSDALLQAVEAEWRDKSRGRAAAIERAARLGAILRGLGYRGVHLGGIHRDFQIICGNIGLGAVHSTTF